jgi:hypothetical protein
LSRPSPSGEYCVVACTFLSHVLLAMDPF